MNSFYLLWIVPIAWRNLKYRGHTVFPWWRKLEYGFFLPAPECLDSTTTPSLQLVHADICPKRAMSRSLWVRSIDAILILVTCALVNSVEQGLPLLSLHPHVLLRNVVTSSSSMVVSSIGPGKEGPGKEGPGREGPGRESNSSSKLCVYVPIVLTFILAFII